MSVTTKRGDSGWTDLLFGGRVRKDDLRIHAVGTLDELNSLLGLAKASIRAEKTRQAIHAIQRDIFIVSSELITLPRNLRRLELRVDDAHVKRLEALTAALERKVKLTECCFLIPGESATSALLDVCRTVARRAERLVVALRRGKAVPNRSVPVYLNRLSDLLYMLARTEERSHKPFIARKRIRRPKRRSEAGRCAKCTWISIPAMALAGFRSAHGRRRSCAGKVADTPERRGCRPRRFEDHRELRSLKVTRIVRGDAGWASLEGSERPASLDVSSTRMTDAGLAELKDMTGLQTLNLGGTKVTDAGLASLEKMERSSGHHLSGEPR